MKVEVAGERYFTMMIELEYDVNRERRFNYLRDYLQLRQIRSLRKDLTLLHEVPLVAPVELERLLWVGEMRQHQES